MRLPSFCGSSGDGYSGKPRIRVLEIRDRERPEGEALGWLLVEREETYRYNPRDGALDSASIRLCYQSITVSFFGLEDGHGEFMGSYSRNCNAVSLTSSSMSGGAVFLGLPERLMGQRIGTYLMNEIVQWVKQWPEAEVNTITLVAGQAQGDNKARRNRFYEQFGLVFDYTDPEHHAGLSQPMLAGDLVNVEMWKKNITEYRMLDYLEDVLIERERLRSELRDLGRVRDGLRSAKEEAEAKPLRWALRQLWRRHPGRIVSIMLIVIAWLKISEMM